MHHVAGRVGHLLPFHRGVGGECAIDDDAARRCGRAAHRGHGDGVERRDAGEIAEVHAVHRVTVLDAPILIGMSRAQHFAVQAVAFEVADDLTVEVDLVQVAAALSPSQASHP